MGRPEVLWWGSTGVQGLGSTYQPFGRALVGASGTRQDLSTACNEHLVAGNSRELRSQFQIGAKIMNQPRDCVILVTVKKKGFNYRASGLDILRAACSVSVTFRRSSLAGTVSFALVIHKIRALDAIFSYPPPARNQSCLIRSFPARVGLQIIE
jgi:hypothetical protein